jgi:nucleoside-diphosphate kinase
VRERELEIAAAEARLSSLEHLHCQYCGFEVERAFLRCPSCLRRLKEPCGVCGKPLDPRWKICPYCEAEVGQIPAEARRQRVRRSGRGGAGPPGGPASVRPPGGAPARRGNGRRRAPGPRVARASALRRLSTPDMDRTLILVKPDAFERRLTGEVLRRFEAKGLTIVAMKHMTVERDLAERHYAEHAEKPFFGDLVEFITGGPLVALVLEGYEAVTAARQVIGATNPLEAAPGSIRGDFGLEVQTNLVHGSDSAESAAREVGLFFPEL